jgi:hypothetical protein
MTERDEGSMLGGHSAKRKFGGPEMYSVASRALTAGVPGKRKAKIWAVQLAVVGLEATLWALRASTRGHSYWATRKLGYLEVIVSPSRYLHSIPARRQMKHTYLQLLLNIGYAQVADAGTVFALHHGS